MQTLFSGFAFTFLFLLNAQVTASDPPHKEVVLVEGNHFSIPDTQQIQFVDLVQTDPDFYSKLKIPATLNLMKTQSDVRSQGNRGACTYFTFTSLVESILKKETGQEVGLILDIPVNHKSI